jgi:hypothetical protein
MRVAIIVYDIADYGGIINHGERLGHGLRALGHTPELVKLSWRTQPPRGSGAPRASRSVFEGATFDQHHGWSLPSRCVVPYRGPALARARERLASYDMLFWSIPVPSANNAGRGNTDWLKLYDTGRPQIAFVHDDALSPAAMVGHGSIAHLALVAEHFAGLACVHPCAYLGAAYVRGKRALVVNPQAPRHPEADAHQRTPGWLSCQTFKSWKRVQDLLNAVPHMSTGISKIMAGGGIQQRYMTSLDKCPPRYMINGKRIWDVAIDHGMKYLGWITDEERDGLLLRNGCLVDSSWRRRAGTFGAHYNRTAVDAIRCGAVPVARTTMMGSTDPTSLRLFEEGVHYVGIPDGTDDKIYAEIVEGAARAPSSEMRRNGAELLRCFDERLIAQRLLDLARGELPDCENNNETSPEILAKAEQIMAFFRNEEIVMPKEPEEQKNELAECS